MFADESDVPVPAAQCVYAQWLAIARRHSRTQADAPDLLQEGLLAALQARRRPLTDPADAAWFHGVLAKLAAFRARSAARGSRRDVAVGLEALGDPLLNEDANADAIGAQAGRAVLQAIQGWPAAQRSVLLLVLHGLDREEIRQVLGLADTALRQRVAALKKRLAGSDLVEVQAPFQRWLAVRGPADAGLRRAVLARGPARIAGFRMGLSDPDGHLLGIQVARARKV